MINHILALLRKWRQPLDFTPCMTQAEVALLERYIPANGYVLEFGGGGSTLLFLSHGASKLITVESDNSWLRLLKKNALLRNHLARGEWLPLHANIGRVKKWGYPRKKNPISRWRNYHEYIWGQIPAADIGFVLVDGRFRVACFCQAALRCTKEDVLFAVHDFWQRPYYHSILDFCDIVDRGDSFVFLRRKKDMDATALKALLEEYQYITK